jgi:hypothetical protein
VWRGGPARSVGELVGELEGEEAQLVPSFIVWPGECPDPRLVDEWLAREGSRASVAWEGLERPQRLQPGIVLNAHSRSAPSLTGKRKLHF